MVALGLLILPELAQQVVGYASKLPGLQVQVAERLGEVGFLGSAAASVKNFDPQSLVAAGGVSKIVSVSGGVLEFLG